MKAMDSSALRIGAWRVDPMLDEMSKDGNTVKLERRAMQLLLCLAEHAGQVVSVEQLLDQVWTGVIVSPDSVYHAVAALRRSLGDDSHDPTYITNVPRRGYRLVAPVAPWVDPMSITDGSSAHPAAATATHIATTTGALFGRYRTVLSIALAAALILALGYFAADKYWLSKHVTAEHGMVATRTTINDKSIAVLPFVDLSEKKDQEYFADGMAEEILDLLATIPALKVIGRTSSFQFKGKNEDLRAIGIKLGVAYVVEGSVRKADGRIRVTAQLIDATTGVHKWSNTYDREVGGVLKVQDQIAASLVRALQVTVGADELQARPYMPHPDAYDVYLHGRHAFDRSDQDGFAEAADDFQQAIDIDSKYADAAAWLALTKMLQPEWGYVPARVGFEQGRDAAELALRLNPRLALAHVALGDMHMVYDWDWAGAEKELKEALALQPRHFLALVVYSELEASLGHWDDAVRLMNDSLAVDPLYPSSQFILGTTRYRSGHLIEAETAMRRGLEISPAYASGHFLLALVLVARGELDAALTEAKLESHEGAQMNALAIVYAAMGRKTEADAALAAITIKYGDRAAWFRALIHAARHENDQVFDCLDKAYALKDSSLYSIKGEPLLRSVENDPRYGAFLRKLNLLE